MNEAVRSGDLKAIIEHGMYLLYDIAKLSVVDKNCMEFRKVWKKLNCFRSPN
jgi:hypothetical protein